MKIRKTCAIVVALVATMVLSLALTGCKKQQPTVTPTPTPADTIEDISPLKPVDENGNEKEIVNIVELDKDEFVALTWEQIRDFAEAKLPKYRDIYGISEDRTMEQVDWEKLKEIMFWQLFNQVYSEYVKVGDVYDEVEVTENDFGTDWIYVVPTEEYLRSLSVEEFREYLTNYCIYHKLAYETEDNQNIWKLLTSDQIEEMREELISEHLDQNENLETSSSMYGLDGEDISNADSTKKDVTSKNGESTENTSESSQ